MDAFTNQADQAKSRWQKAGGKVATASILKLAATAAADERENPEAEPEPEKPPTECEVMVEKVRQLIYGDKPEEKPELIDPDNPSPRESEEGDADKERAADKAKRCGKRLVWVLLILQRVTTSCSLECRTFSPQYRSNKSYIYHFNNIKLENYISD